MNVVVNGEARLLDPGTTVSGLVEHLGCSPKGMAVAVNQEVVPRSTWPEAVLRPDDVVELLTASQGG